MTLGWKIVGLQRRPLDMVTGRDLEDGQLEGQLAEDLDQELGKGCVGNGWKTHLVFTNCGVHFLPPWIA